MRPFILAAIIVTALCSLMIGGVSADGNGSPSDCDGGPSTTGDPVASYDASDGNLINGVCIKSGNNMFDGNKHSGVLGNGTYENGCYEIDGVGTQVVTVTRLLSGNTCQDISHIDLILGTCGSQCDPQCQQDCDPECQQDCEDPCDVQALSPDCTPNPCDDEDAPAECDPLVEVCFEGEVIEVPASQAGEDTGDCETIACVNGDFVPVSDETKATNDCGPVRLCVDGESVTVTEFDSANDPDLRDGDSGSCTPSESPPSSTPISSPTLPVEAVQEVQSVQNVAPIAEVAALPSAGYGEASDSASEFWVIALSALLGGLGGLTAYTSRKATGLSDRH